MKKITKITPQIKNEDRVNIFVNEDFFMSIDSFYLSDLGIKVGMEISPELENILNATSQQSNCLRKAFSLLAYRDRTSFELIKRLKEAYFTNDEIDYTIKKLESMDYINNEKFIKTYIEFEKNKGSSPIKISVSLQNMGIPSSESKPLIDKFYLEDEQIKSAKILLIKKADILKNLDNYTKKQKLIAYLSRKGFDFHIIFDLIDDFILQDDKNSV